MPQSVEMTPPQAGEGELLWQPTEEQKQATNLARYLKWLATTRGLRFADYPELWRWSVTDLDAFWESIWDYFEVGPRDPGSAALAESRMPGARRVPGARLNYAERALQRRDD